MYTYFNCQFQACEIVSFFAQKINLPLFYSNFSIVNLISSSCLHEDHNHATWQCHCWISFMNASSTSSHLPEQCKHDNLIAGFSSWISAAQADQKTVGKKIIQENTATNEQLVNQSQADPNRGREMADFVKSQPLITRVWREQDDDEA